MNEKTNIQLEQRISELERKVRESEPNFRDWRKFDSVTDQFSPITGASQMIGFFGTPKISKPTITGAKGGNAALTSVCSVLATLGLVINSTS